MRLLIPLFLSLGLVACGGGDDDTKHCMDDLPESCNALYEPAFDQVYTRSLEGSCALAGCHDATSAESGLDLSDADRAYDALATLVVAGEPECSVLMMRLEGHGLDLMPPGAKLPAGELCAIQQWIEDGAER